MEFSDYRTALVTGASSGIGAATVRRLRTEGLEVHALARDAHRLAELSAETGCRVCAIDVNDLEALTRLATSAEFDVLINNAGQSRRGNILDTARDDVDTLVDVNLRAVLHLTRLLVPGMAKQQSWPRGQRLVDRRPLCLRRERDDIQFIRCLSRDEGGHTFAFAAAACRSLRYLRSRHGSIAWTCGDEHLPKPKRC
jgi:NAD(P)-dependent dehydrogenase (short-subunit alcohol dehydrogenase family)